MRRRPYAIVLLDEFEKAHRDVSTLLLQVVDAGQMAGYDSYDGYDGYDGYADHYDSHDGYDGYDCCGR